MLGSPPTRGRPSWNRKMWCFDQVQASSDSHAFYPYQLPGSAVATSCITCHCWGSLEPGSSQPTTFISTIPLDSGAGGFRDGGGKIKMQKQMRRT